MIKTHLKFNSLTSADEELGTQCDRPYRNSTRTMYGGGRILGLSIFGKMMFFALQNKILIDNQEGMYRMNYIKNTCII